MVRMSDILKKLKEKKEKEEAPSQPAPLEPRPFMKGRDEPPETKFPAQPKPEVSHTPLEVKLSPVVMKEVKITSSEENLKLYHETESLISELLKKYINITECKLEDIKKLAAQVEKIINQLILGNDELLMLAFSANYVHDDYLPPHLVNVCIYAIEVGLGLNYTKPELMDLGLSALIHDVGMIKYKDLAYLPRKLTSKEKEEIKNHPIVGVQILENIINLNKALIRTVKEEHERCDGSGYPKGLKEKFIDEYAKIIGLVDTYEAMTHQRSYRSDGHLLPQEAIREILSTKDVFLPKVIKVMIERIGIYPVGSFVRLNTKEIAQVIKFNHEYPLRPTIKILYDTNSEKLKEEKVLNLAVLPNIYIAKSISIEKEVK